ncbi:Glutamate--tRNA ligase 1 [Caulifigura coniformis]|uniref:Glutamate--tRNA ligase n=1 Tax=Caulifigura coniformis TaxID=2527983 RepID=A0A517SHF9_9PLAN|nr:glutamate--tRNA ligase [Caulifigura coniformis]QDT55555.1 Glutamate--tRNA ligase 1 [Caulifigura coniformis]
MSVRTRFAPSPTGYMHIGGMRTALFNWLWARHNGGQFILRIDDTDRERNVEAALQPILDAFRWMNLPWDEGPEIGGPHAPYYQSQRNDRYREVVRQLVDSGKAYRDYETAEQTKADRDAAEKEKRPYVSSRRSLGLSDETRAEYEATQVPYVVRLLVPRERKVSINDHVRGFVEWDCSLIPDPVIQRSDGSPLYNFATVVDDVDFEITHVIRAEEHLTNTAVQHLIYEAIGAKPPEFAHIPFVAAPGTTKKLSKREIGKYRNNPQFKRMFEIADTVLPKLGMKSDDSMNPVMVAFYEQVGFLPEAVFNALARLGWSLDDKTEYMSREFVIENFTLERVVKGAAGLDCDKLMSYQEHWMAKLSVEEKVTRCLPFLERAGYVASPADSVATELATRLVVALGERIKLFSDILSYEEYFVADDALAYDEKAFEKRIRKADGAVELLKGYGEMLATQDDFSAATLEQATHSFVEFRGLGLGDIVHAVRVATTGKPAGPGLYDCLALLGRDKCLKRIERALARA